MKPRNGRGGPALDESADEPNGGWVEEIPPGASYATLPMPRPIVRPAGGGAVVPGGDRGRAFLEDQVLLMVNAQRRRYDLPPVRPDARLREAARRHSADMAARRFFDHQNPDGLTAMDRMLLARFPDPAAENIAMGQPHPAEAMRAWMNSPGHRVNILLPTVRWLGVGLEPAGPGGGPWWTQNFGY
ncbi:CAP domain-containing protein [Streptomyces sp. NPDC048290]|uniref:CAP domain-containing protein n=1 Tax=Streptomyces sp. NPDC048290 TaxID=3155811 RepID=UPI003414779D